MRRLILGLVLLLLAACSTDSEFTMDDQMFAAMMVPHHEQAIVMSEIALENSTNPEILKLANEIKAAQQPEIDQMLRWGGSMMGSHAGHQMAGMFSDAEIEELKQSSGIEFDRKFLLGMIKHHEGAIEMAEMVIDFPTKAAAELGKAITITQQQEIKLMQELLVALSG